MKLADPRFPRPRSAGFSLPVPLLLLVASAALAWWVGWYALLAVPLAIVLVTVPVAIHDQLRGTPEPELPSGQRIIDSPAPGHAFDVEAVAPALPSFEHARAFRNLADLVAFVGDCLERDDRAVLAAACAGDEGEGSVTDGAFKWLRAHQSRASLIDLYREQQLPNAAGTFKLGGHDRELGHVHVDLASPDGRSWHLVKIWQCR